MDKLDNQKKKETYNSNNTINYNNIRSWNNLCLVDSNSKW